MVSIYYHPGEPHAKIGASCHVFEIDDKTIVHDCGSGLDKDENGRKIRYVPRGDFLQGKRVDLILISHQHDDHIGAIPALVRHHPEAQIIISRTAYEIAPITFDDSLVIMEREGELNGTERLFNVESVEKFFDNPNLQIIEPDEIGWAENPWGWEGWEIGTHPAGHYIGALSYYMISPSGKRIMITGDTCSHNQKTVKGVMLPNDDFLGDFLNSDVTLITEATNAARVRKESREESERKLCALIDEAEARGGAVFIPTFWKQRATEIALTLVEKGYRVHLDGKAQFGAPIEAPRIEEFVKQGRIVLLYSSSRESMRHHRKCLAHGSDSCGPEVPIIITSSATMEHGPSVQYAIEVLPDERSVTIFVGHVFENTPAYQLKSIEDVKKGHTITLNNYGKSVHVNVRCKVAHLEGFSAHDDQKALLERVGLVKPRTLIVHHTPGIDEYNTFREKVLELSHPPERIFYAPVSDFIEL